MDFNYDNTIDMINDAYNDCEGNPKTFRKLLEETEKHVCPGCTKFTKLSRMFEKVIISREGAIS